MNLNERRQFILRQKNQFSLFPSLKKTYYAGRFQCSNNANISLDQKTYRMTSNQILRGITKQHQSEIKKLRTTFLKQGEERIKKKIGQYQIIREIGKGGFAQVYQVQDTKHRRFAIKQYNLQNSLECFHNQSTVGHFFFDNGKIRKQFQDYDGSQHLIKFYEKFRIGKFGYVVQELSQHNFSKLISEIQGVFHNNERIYQVKFKDFYCDLVNKNYLHKIMIQICQAIRLINDSGFIHCDLKLENIMVQYRGSEPFVKVIDFGSTFELQQGLPKITITPEYMPPQLLLILQNGSNGYQILKKVDVWSIGCILLQILTGIPLWFRYKCRVEIKGKPTIQLGIFALTGRQYHKIIKKQRQLCQSVNRISFTLKQFQKYRPLLKRILVFNPQKRITLEQCLQMLYQIQ